MNSLANKIQSLTLLSALLSLPLTVLAASPIPTKSQADEPRRSGIAAAPAATQQRSASAAADAPQPFNRLLKPGQKRDAGTPIYDAANEGTNMLQPPGESFARLPKSEGGFGNGVDWVKALQDGKVKPRWDRTDVNAKPVVMDLEIVREVKGSMPNVGFPHKQHTEWLECSNCHPAIFIPQKGANQMSMAAIIQGQQCGVCHGKVAFPISECSRCHSKSKTAALSPGGKK